MKTIRFVLIVVLCNFFLASVALASLKEVRLFPGLANDKNWATFVAQSTEAGKVNSKGIDTDFLAEGSMDYMLNSKDDLSAALRKSVKPEMLEEIKAGKYENYFQFFREFNGFGERVPLVTLKRLVSIREGEEGIFAPMHIPLENDQAVEIIKKPAATNEVLSTNKIVKPSSKPEMDAADKFAEHIANLGQKVRQLSANQGGSKEVQALKTQINSLRSQLTQLTNNQRTSTATVKELQTGIKNLDTQLNEFTGSVSDLSSLVSDFSAGFQAKFDELEGKVPGNNLWLIIASVVIAVIALLLSVLVYRKNSSDKVAQAKTNKEIQKELAGVKAVANKASNDIAEVAGLVERLDQEILEAGIAGTGSVANANAFCITDEKSLTNKTLANLPVGGSKNIDVQVGDKVLEVTFEKKSDRDVLVHGIKRHSSATEATISVSVTANPGKVIRNAISRHCLIGTASVVIGRVA